MMPLLISMGGVVVKCALWKEVDDSDYMLPTSSTTSSGYLRYFIMTNNHG